MKKVADHSFAYKNITISGLPGAGSTTLLAQLKDALKFDKWTGFSGGEFMRAYAAENNLFDSKLKLHHSSMAYGEEFDRKVDMGIREKLSTEKRWIIESWLSGFLAQGVKGTLKVLMLCSEESIRIDRIVNRDAVTVDTAKANISKRYNENLKKWSNLYSKEWKKWVVDAGKMSKDDPIDFWSPDLYDVVLDTYSLNQQQAVDKVLDALKNKKD
ncbi:MAG: AAA family ATPase [Candidatus Pacebacteria bacterium]|jgi:cytidylate kinase|nr:AAA family ATPase [Candidatus Paceibacterota bacterium]MBT4652521.1 AAA family ATPase [Candidatus Paceibacterota bacterium]MBT6756348.1 AAA family ATPase [Candidatus Paceibacterota bacterium]MBT6921639.1 AAA family ATPase [Candidatus Paceibacterota bacterium]